MDTIKVCTSYISEGKEIDYIPYDEMNIVPVYKEFKGWKIDISSATKYEDLPKEFKSYVEYIEKETGVSISIISIGPERDKTIIR